MNKKLAELFEQAHKDFIGEDYYTGMPITTRELDPEKFAELIVRACCDILEQDAIQYEDDQWASLASAVRDSKYKIQQYFEVKQ
jgi:hypothetical protein